MLTIYGALVSGNCLKVKWTAERVGRPFRWVETSVLAGETRTPEFLALNPAGQVPVAVLEDGRPLAQSNAICLHLAEGSDLVPADAYHRARMFEWLFWEQYSHEPYIAVARFQLSYQKRPREELDPKLWERGEAALAQMDAGLAGGGFLVGGSLTVADISLVAYTRVAHEGGFDLSRHPHVQAWVGRVEAELGL